MYTSPEKPSLWSTGGADPQSPGQSAGWALPATSFFSFLLLSLCAYSPEALDLADSQPSGRSHCPQRNWWHPRGAEAISGFKVSWTPGQAAGHQPSLELPSPCSPLGFGPSCSGAHVSDGQGQGHCCTRSSHWRSSWALAKDRKPPDISPSAWPRLFPPWTLTAWEKMPSLQLSPTAPLKLQTAPRDVFILQELFFLAYVSHTKKKSFAFFKTSNTK